LVDREAILTALDLFLNNLSHQRTVPNDLKLKFACKWKETPRSEPDSLLPLPMAVTSAKKSVAKAAKAGAVKARCPSKRATVLQQTSVKKVN
jgi:hypothetical protein